MIFIVVVYFPLIYYNEHKIITSNFSHFGISDLIKVFDLNGNKIKEINDSKNNTYFIESYYDERLLKNYIIAGNKSYAKSYYYNENKIYHIYSNDCSIRIHYNIIININKNVTKLIG